MTTALKTSYFNRPDTMLGVCQAIGDDLGINANWLRIALAVSMFFFPWQTVLGYLAVGALNLVLRRIWPDEVASTESEIAQVPDSANSDADVRLAA